MFIRLACQCGARFRTTNENAGKRTRCPACESEIVVPQDGGETAAPGTTGPTSSNACPSCGAPMQPASVLCMCCGFHAERGHRLKTVVKKPIRRRSTPFPGMAVEESGGQLRITQRGLFMSSTLDVNEQEVRVRPSWLGGKTLCSDAIAQIYVTRCVDRNNGGSISFNVMALMKNGRRRRLMSFGDEDAALYVEERIEEFLDIEDEDVSRFTAPRVNFILKGVLWMICGVFGLGTVSVVFNKDVTQATVAVAFGLGLIAFGARSLYLAAFADRKDLEDRLQS